MKKILKTTFLIAFIILSGVILTVFVSNHPRPTIVLDTVNNYKISHDSGFYKQSIRISLSAEHASIYYTTDGSEPSSNSANSVLYEKPISIKSDNHVKSHHLKFRFYEENGTASKVYHFTYFVGKNVEKRFNTYVAHISGNPDDLFGYENGIFVEGKLRDEFLSQNPDVTEAYNMDPANYNLRGKEAERAVNFQLFDSDGKLLTSQNCGLRIFGNFSRGKYQKSFQLFARNEYDMYGKFHTALFPTVTSTVDGSMLSKNNRLVFRNSGNDFGKAFIRDTLIQELGADTGFPMCTPYVPAAVYINGEYYGFYWVKEPFNNGQMEELYGNYNGTFERVSINEFYKTAEDSTEPLAAEYQEIYDTYAEADLTDEQTYSQLCEKIDISNYLQYYAMELFIANKDWPYNNVRAYRYVANDGIYYENTLLDGKYRYLFFDTDYGFGLNDDVPGYRCDEDNISILLNNYQSPLFCNLMARADCREMFVNHMCDLMNTGFSYANIEQTLLSLAAIRENELTSYVHSVLKPSFALNMDMVNAATAEILSFAQNRHGYVYSFLQNDYAVFSPYILQINADSNLQTSVNSIASIQYNQATAYGNMTPNVFSGIYYADCSLTLSAKADEGHEFDYWDINGQHYTEEMLILSPEDIASLLTQTTNGQLPELHVKVVQRDKADAQIIISEIHAKDENDMVTLYNPSEHNISLSGLYLSDDASALKKAKIPELTLSAGESYRLYGSKNVVSRSMGVAKLGFSLRKEETLYLSDENGNIIEQILIPDLARSDTSYIRNPYTGMFRECE